MNVQVACTTYGKLAWISDPVNRSRQDNYCQPESGVLLAMNPKNWIGDKGYIGNKIITPYRKPAGGELLDWQKEYNNRGQQYPRMIEQVISHFKNWTIMHTDYRRPIKTFATTISGGWPCTSPGGVKTLQFSVTRSSTLSSPASPVSRPNATYCSRDERGCPST